MISRTTCRYSFLSSAFLVALAFSMVGLTLPSGAEERKASRIFEALVGRPILVQEETGAQPCNFKPPFQYSGPFFSDSFARSTVKIAGVEAGSEDPELGVWMLNSSCGLIVIGKSVVSKGNTVIKGTAPGSMKPAEIPSLLKSDNPVKRATAIWILTREGDPKKVSSVLSQLHDTDPLVRMYVLRGLATLSGPKAELLDAVTKAPPAILSDFNGRFFEAELAAVQAEALRRLAGKDVVGK